MGTDIPRVPLQPVASALDAGALMRLRLMLLERGGAAFGLAAEMAGDLPAAVEDIDHLPAQADIDLLADILVGNRVEVPVDRNVVVGVDRVLAPLRALPAPVRQGPHVGEVDALEAAVPVLARAVGIGPVVDFPSLGGDRPVQRRQVMEDMVAQRREDPAFSMKHTLFDESLVAGAPNARREALGAVMVEQIGVGLVQDRLVARRPASPPA